MLSEAGVDVPLVKGVFARDCDADGGFAFESIVIVTGPYEISSIIREF